MHALIIELDRYRWDVIGLAKKRWKNPGERIIDEGHKIIYSGQEKYHKHGVAYKKIAYHI